MARNRTTRACAFCGEVRLCTSDHIPPRSYFEDDLPKGVQLITVPGCDRCNNGRSSDDDYFRTVVGLRREVEDNPTIQKIMPKMLRGIELAGKGGATGPLMATSREAPIFTPSGLYLGRGGSYEPDDAQVCAYVARLVRGLYFHEHKQRLPDDFGVLTYVVANFVVNDVTTLSSMQRLVDFAMAGRMVVVHRDVFSYAYNIAPGDQPVTVWLMMFFNHTPMLSFVVPRATHSIDRPLF